MRLPALPAFPELPQPDFSKLPNLNRATVAGISVAICGNVLIFLALNCQKLAHRRLELEREQNGVDLEHNGSKSVSNGEPRIDEEEESEEYDEEEAKFLLELDEKFKTPVIMPRRKFTGHCNVETVKDGSRRALVYLKSN